MMINSGMMLVLRVYRSARRTSNGNSSYKHFIIVIIVCFKRDKKGGPFIGSRIEVGTWAVVPLPRLGRTLCYSYP